jgi:hypothetical protein
VLLFLAVQSTIAKQILSWFSRGAIEIGACWSKCCSTSGRLQFRPRMACHRQAVGVERAVPSPNLAQQVLFVASVWSTHENFKPQSSREEESSGWTYLAISCKKKESIGNWDIPMKTYGGKLLNWCNKILRHLPLIWEVFHSNQWSWGMVMKVILLGNDQEIFVRLVVTTRFIKCWRFH